MKIIIIAKIPLRIIGSKLAVFQESINEFKNPVLKVKLVSGAVCPPGVVLIAEIKTELTTKENIKNKPKTNKITLPLFLMTKTTNDYL